jgi:F0F1-type ATP synthase membrane subunit b/b'
MCQPKSEGGKRCDCDNSLIRRLRRKASELRKPRNIPEVDKASHAALPEPESLSIRELKEKAQALHELAHSKPEGISLSEHDANVERQITTLGMSISQEARSTLSRSKEDVDAEIEAHNTKIITDLDEEEKQLFALRKENRAAFMEIQNEGYVAPPDENSEVPLEGRQLQVAENIKQAKSISKQLEALAEKRNSLVTQQQEYAKKAYADYTMELANAYQDVIKQIRPVGGEISYKVGKPEEADKIKKLFSETVEKNYPTAWLKNHNDSATIKIETETERPGYTATLLSKTEHDGELKPKADVGKSVTFSPGNQAEKVKRLFKKAFEGQDIPLVSSYNKDGEVECMFVYAGPEYELYDETIHSPLVDGKPEGEGWEYRPTPASIDIMVKHRSQNLDILLKPRWSRIAKTTLKREPRLTVYSKEHLRQIGLSEAHAEQYEKAVAYHEFAHRVEHVFPDNLLARQEKAFLKRRSNRSDETLHDSMKAFSSKEYVVYNEYFVTAYTGKDYFTGRSYEVFSTGIESAYGGSYGGLVKSQLHAKKADYDHLGFTLGALAAL